MEESPVIEENELRAALSEARSEQGELFINTDIDDSSSTDSACTTGTRTSPPRNVQQGQGHSNPNHLNRSQHDTSTESHVSSMEVEGRTSMENQNNATPVLRRSVETAHSYVSPPETSRQAPTPMPNSGPATADPAAAAAAAAQFAHAQAQTMHQRQMQYSDRRPTTEAYGHPAHFGTHSAPPQQHRQQQHLPSYREAFAHRLQTHHQYDARAAAAAAAMYGGYGTGHGNTYGAPAATEVYGSAAQQQQYFQQQQLSYMVHGHPGYHTNHQRFPVSAADVHHQQQQHHQATYGVQRQQRQYHQPTQPHESRLPASSHPGTSEVSAEQPEVAATAAASNQQQSSVVEAIHNALIGLGADPGNIGSVNTLPRGEHVILLPHAGNPLDHLFTQVLIVKPSYQLMSIPNTSVPTSSTRSPTAGPKPPSGGGGQGHPDQGPHQRHPQPNQWNQNQGTRCPQHGHIQASPDQTNQHQQHQMYFSPPLSVSSVDRKEGLTEVKINYHPSDAIPFTGFNIQPMANSSPVQGFGISNQPVGTAASARGRGRGGKPSTTPKRVFKSKGKDLRSLGLLRSNRNRKPKTETSAKQPPKPRSSRGTKKVSVITKKPNDEASSSVVKTEPALETEAGGDGEVPDKKLPKLPFLTIMKVTTTSDAIGNPASVECPEIIKSDPHMSEGQTGSAEIKVESDDSDCVEILPEHYQQHATSRELRKRKPVLYFDPSQDPNPRISRAAKRSKKEPTDKAVSARRKRCFNNLNQLRLLQQIPFEELQKTGIKLLPPKRYANSKKIIFVDPKQYNRILERRRIRESMEASGRLPLHRSKTYIHESRHRHAVTRPRYPNGKFMKKADILAAKNSPSDTTVQEPNPDDVFKKPLPPKVAAAQRAAAKKATAAKLETPASATSKIVEANMKPQAVHQQIMAERQRKIFQLQFKRLGPEQKEALLRIVQSKAMMAKGKGSRSNVAKPTAPQMQLMINLMKKLYERNSYAVKRNIPATVSRAPDVEPAPTDDTLKQEVPTIVVSFESRVPEKTAELKMPEVTLTAIK